MNEYEKVVPAVGAIPPPPDAKAPQETPELPVGDYEALGAPDEKSAPADLSNPVQKIVKRGEKRNYASAQKKENLAEKKNCKPEKKIKRKKSTKRKQEESTGSGSTEGEVTQSRRFCTVNCICVTLIAIVLTAVIFGAALVTLHLTTAINWIPQLKEFYNRTIG